MSIQSLSGGLRLLYFTLAPIHSVTSDSTAGDTVSSICSVR